MSEDVKAFDDAANAASFEASVTTPAVSVGSTPIDTPVETSTETAEVAVSPTVADAKPVAPETQDAPEYQNLLAKYGGDKNAAAKAFWETNNRASQLAKEKEELAAQLAALQKPASPAAPEAAKPAQEIPTELRRYDDEMRKVETTFKSTQQEKATYVNERRRIGNEILLTQRKWSSNDLTIDRDALSTTLNNLVGEQLAVDAYLAELETKLQGYDEKWQDIKDRRDIRAQLLDTAKELKTEREAKARSTEDAEETAYKQQFSTSWNGTIEKVSKDTTLIPAVLSQRFEKFVRIAGKAFVADGNPIEDVGKFVTEAAKDFVGGAKDFHSAQAAEYGRQKKEDAAISSPDGANAMASETKRPRAQWTPQEWEKHLETVNL